MTSFIKLNSLRTRLVLLLSVAQIAFLGTLLSMGVYFLNELIQEQLEKRISAITQQFESATKTAMVSSDLATIQSISDEAVKLPDIVEFNVSIQDKVIAKSQSDHSFSSHRLTIQHLVIASEQVVGKFEFSLSLDSLEQSKKNILNSLLEICLLELLIAISVAILIGRYIGRRSNYLINGIDRYKAGEINFQYENITQDEFGLIATAFNSMSHKSVEDSKKLENLRVQTVETAKMASLGEMGSRIAHEINNPLSITLSKAALLSRKVKANEFEKVHFEFELERIQETTKRIAKIISGLRTFSRNAENDPLQPMNISEVIEETLSLCIERFKTNSIDLRVQIESDPNLIIKGRPAQIAQVLLNLLNNSFDAVMQFDKRWVQLKTESTDHILIISVTDCGHGIPEALQSKLMEPFFTTKDVGKGTGLGLSISKGIIEGHYGKFYYDQNSPHTRFVIELPT